MADNESLWLTRVGSVRLDDLARGVKMTDTLTEVYLAPRLAKQLSYGKLERKGFVSCTMAGNKRVSATQRRYSCIRHSDRQQHMVRLDDNYTCKTQCWRCDNGRTRSTCDGC